MTAELAQRDEPMQPRRFPRAYTIADKSSSLATVGGTDALDALTWYARPTPEQRELLGFDAATDTAAFNDLRATRTETTGSRYRADGGDR